MSKIDALTDIIVILRWKNLSMHAQYTHPAQMDGWMGYPNPMVISQFPIKRREMVYSFE